MRKGRAIWLDASALIGHRIGRRSAIATQLLWSESLPPQPGKLTRIDFFWISDLLLFRGKGFEEPLIRFANNEGVGPGSVHGDIFLNCHSSCLSEGFGIGELQRK